MESSTHPVRESEIKTQCEETGAELSKSMRALLDAVAAPPQSTGKVAQALGVDKVLASRFLKMVRSGDPLATLHATPGPGPLRRVIEASATRGADRARLDQATKATDRFERLIQESIGDRSALQTLLSGWLPEARREFELRRKQSAFRATSEIHGCSSEVSMSTVLLHPAEEPGRIDVVWLFGVFELRRVRPGARVRLASRRVANIGSPRRPTTLKGQRVDDLRGLRLPEFCSTPEAEIDVHSAGEVVRYVIDGNIESSMKAVDLVFAEVNLAEIESTLHEAATRSAYFFCETSIPTRKCHFDVLVHRDVYPGIQPRLVIYDTSFEGIASVNDPSRDLDILDLDERIDTLGSGIDRFRTRSIPGYATILGRVFESLMWDANFFAGYRAEIDFPIYGSQITMSFDPPRLGAAR